jgi:hypothetical protein
MVVSSYRIPDRSGGLRCRRAFQWLLLVLWLTPLIVGLCGEAYVAVSLVADVSAGYAIVTAVLLAASGGAVAYLVSRMMRPRELSLMYRLAWIGLPLLGLLIVWFWLFLLGA